MKLRLPRAYRTILLAVAVSAAAHAAFVAGLPDPLFGDAPAPQDAPSYVATLVPAPHDPDDLPKPKDPPEPQKPKPQRVPHRHALRHPVVAQAAAAQAVAEPIVAKEPILVPASFEPIAEPQALASLDTSALPLLPEPPADLADLAAEKFPVDALPDDLEIDYALTSAIADAHAVYRWQRDGDHYRITGEGAADGFFSLFLDGRMLQESEGTVTRSGLRPVRFVERKPNTADEGLQFDWGTHQVTFELGERKKTGKLSDNSVDWLSMIFQLAHAPPTSEARDMQISVLTQRKLYRFDLRVLGEEDIVIPLGHVRTLHLRHIDAENPNEVVDVWLGMDQHYLPVKLRYPVARNRLVVEQIATRLSSR